MIAKLCEDTKANLSIRRHWLVSWGHTYAAEEACMEIVAKTVSIQGQVGAYPVSTGQWKAVHLNTKICPGYQSHINAKGRARQYHKNGNFQCLGKQCNDHKNTGRMWTR